MSTSKGRRIRQSAGLLTLAAAVALGLGGCSGGCSREKGPEVPGAVDPAKASSFADRMHDPEYLKALKASDEGMRAIMKRTVELQKALELAKAENPDSPEVKRLQAELEKCAAELEANRQQAQKVVRDRLHQARAEQEKFVEEQQRKGN